MTLSLANKEGRKLAIMKFTARGKVNLSEIVFKYFLLLRAMNTVETPSGTTAPDYAAITTNVTMSCL